MSLEYKIKAMLATVNPEDDECLIWTNATNEHGYGLIQDRGGNMLKVHRVAFSYSSVLLPEDLVLHTCDNPPCFRPSHLFKGTHQDNVRDAMEKGRHSPPPITCGEKHYCAVLTEKDVLEIRGLAVTSNLTHKEIASMYGVQRPMISKIIRREKWKHI